tara:strand:- start:506 stop:1015 length:510 start_codon:yes stop_codon:yes gene_type:complete
MKIQIGENTKHIVWDFVKNNNIGKRHKGANGTKKDQYTGMLGEYVVKKKLGLDIDLVAGFDGGWDLVYKGLKIDVKTTLRKVPPREWYVHNLVAFQKDFDCEAYIFCTLNSQTYELTIDGWITKEDFFEKATKFKKGTYRKRDDGTKLKLKATGYEINISDLDNINNLI